MRYSAWWIGWFFLLGLACEPVGEELAFFNVTTEPWSREDLELGQLRLRGNITGTDGQGVTDHGFYFATDRTAVVAGDPAVALAKGPGTDGVFDELSAPLDPDRWYFFRAYAQRENRLIVGGLDSFRLGLAIELEPVGRRRNDTLAFRLRVTGFDGFDPPTAVYTVYRRNGPSSWTAVEVDSFDLELMTTVEFDIVFPDFNTEYAVAPHVRGSRIYGGSWHLLKVTDGWRSFEDFELPVFLAGASVVAHSDTVYLSGGYLSRGSLDQNHALYALAPSAGESPDAWRWEDVTGQFCHNYLGSSEGVSLWHDGGLYAGLGVESYQGFTVFDLFELGRTPENCANDQLQHSYRNTVAFAAANKWYVGTGSVRNASGGADEMTGSFRTLDPNTGLLSAQPLAPLPLTVDENTLVSLPRTGAVTFSIGNNHYVGGGWSPPVYLKDFYRFVAPSGEEPARWELAAVLPETARGREEAIAFSIDGRGYMGMGVTTNDARLADLWMFDPVTQSWQSRQPLPGAARSAAVGFAIGEYACVCGGERRLEDTPGEDAVAILRDCWIYYPEKFD